jgi:hypothetical protein
MKNALLVTLCMLGLSIAAPVFAHHGTAINYDGTKWDVVTGTVTEFAWKNPHGQLYMDVKDSKGNILHYAVELNSPGVMAKQGWTRHEFKPGDTVSITVHSSLVGAPLGECASPEQCKATVNGQPAPTDADATPSGIN